MYRDKNHFKQYSLQASALKLDYAKNRNVVNECAAAGIAEIVQVTHSSKNAIENHFDTLFNLEVNLKTCVKR